MAVYVDENSNNTVLQGLLNETLCRRPVAIKTEPISNAYDVEPRPFARGKFATVRRCQHRDSGLNYAAKYIRKRRRAADVRHEIMHEAYVLDLSSENPHIVQLHEVYETHSEIILVLEMVSGGELQRVLDDEEVVPERETAHLMRQILAGVAFLHDHNIAHLDLKPQNLLLTKPFPHCEVKLCDFGISRFITKGIEIREIAGTPDYVAPEVLHYEPISLATDMWSIGILTYVLLSGHSPFGGDTKQETFCNITRGTLEFPADLFGSVSNHAKDFIRRLLVRNPSERLTAKECLSHPWLCQDSSGSSVQGIEITLTPSNSTTDSSSIPASEGEEMNGSTPPCVEKGPRNRKSWSPSFRKRSIDLMSPSTDLKHNKTKGVSENGCHKMAPQCETSVTNGNAHSEQKQISVRNVEKIVTEFEGLKVTKRIIFSEEIIVDERVGIVY